MTPRPLRTLLAIVLGATAAGCSESALTPDSDSLSSAAARIGADRVLAIELTAASAGDAGMVFRIEGPNILDVQPATGYELVKSQADTRGRTIVNALLVGSLRSGPVAYAMVKGTSSGNPYTTTVDQVAAGASGNFAQRTDLGAYQLTVRPLK